MDDKIRPTVSYVQNLGPEYLDQILEATRWVYQHKPDAPYEVGDCSFKYSPYTKNSINFKIFTAELVELPRSKVADFLEDDLNPALCARYIEYLIEEREEVSTLFHDRLAELYLEMAVSARKKRDEGNSLSCTVCCIAVLIHYSNTIDAHQQAYDKFLRFIQSSDIYRVDRLFGLLPSEGKYFLLVQ